MNIKLTKPKGVTARKVVIGMGAQKRTLLVLSPESGAADAPGVLWIHGGGLCAAVCMRARDE